MNRAFFAFLLAELEEKFKGVMPDLEEVRIAALFPTPIDGRIAFGIVNTHDEPALLNAREGRQAFAAYRTLSRTRNSRSPLLMPEVLWSALNY
jgi:hypothetical protein